LYTTVIPLTKFIQNNTFKCYARAIIHNILCCFGNPWILFYSYCSRWMYHLRIVLDVMMPWGLILYVAYRYMVNNRGSLRNVKM